jgi:hypothetical protein
MDYIHNRTYKSLISIALSLSFLTSCQRIPEEKLSCDLPSWQTVVDNENVSSTLDISLNVDGSDSMLGYVTIPNNNYMKTLNLLANTIIGTDTVNVEYKRIGDPQPLTRNQFLRDAVTQAFYDSNGSTYKPVSSPIQSAITPPISGKNKMTIIVTDLEGDDGGKVSEVLAKYYLNKKPENQDYTVGIWGVKSQFQGNIYNPNTGKAKFTYDTEGKKIEEYRPFYVLFIGKRENIVDYFNELKKLDPQIDVQDEMFVLPTANSLIKPLSLGAIAERKINSELPATNQLQRVFALEDNRVAVSLKNSNSEPYELLEIVDETEPQPTIYYRISFPEQNQDGYSLSIDTRHLKTQTKVFTFNKESSNVESSQSQSEAETSSEPPKLPQEKTLFQLNPNSTLQQALTIDNLAIDDRRKSLDFTTTIDLNSLPNPQIYLFEVDLLLDDLSSLDWWNDWSFNNQASNLDGSKTQNLAIFINKLKSLKLQTLQNENQQIVIGRLCFGVNKN